MGPRIGSRPPAGSPGPPNRPRRRRSAGAPRPSRVGSRTTHRPRGAIHPRGRSPQPVRSCRPSRSRPARRAARPARRARPALRPRLRLRDGRRWSAHPRCHRDRESPTQGHSRSCGAPGRIPRGQVPPSRCSRAAAGSPPREAAATTRPRQARWCRPGASARATGGHRATAGERPPRPGHRRRDRGGPRRRRTAAHRAVAERHGARSGRTTPTAG